MISIGNCPECDHFPTQLISENGLDFGRHLVCGGGKGSNISLNREYECSSSEMNAYKQQHEQLKKQLEEQVAYGEHLKEFIEYVDSHAMGLMSFECQKRLKQEPNPELVAQFKADAIRGMINSIDDGHKGYFKIEWAWDYANQLTKDEDLI